MDLKPQSLNQIAPWFWSTETGRDKRLMLLWASKLQGDSLCNDELQKAPVFTEGEGGSLEVMADGRGEAPVRPSGQKLSITEE